MNSKEEVSETQISKDGIMKTDCWSQYEKLSSKEEDKDKWERAYQVHK